MRICVCCGETMVCDTRDNGNPNICEACKQFYPEDGTVEVISETHEETAPLVAA